MKILSLLPPKLSVEDMGRWKAKILSAKDVLKLLDGHLVRQLTSIGDKLDSTSKYNCPGYDRYISELLGARIELKRLRELVQIDGIKEDIQ